MKKLKQQIQETVERECYRGGFDSQVSVKERTSKPHFEMHTSLETRDTVIGYHPEYEETHPGKTEIVTRDGARHEINHHRYEGFNGCPRILDNHSSLIYEPMADILMQQGFSPEDVHYCSNAFEDTILHSDLSKGFSLEGITHFFEDVGETQENQKFTPFYQAHSLLNMYLWGNKKQRRTLNKFYTNDEKVREVLTNFIQRTGLNELKTDGLKDRQKLRNQLNNEQNWPELARIYAEEFSKLMQQGYALSLPNHTGSGTKGREQESSEAEGNEFDKEMKSKKFKKVRIKRAYESEEETPIWMNDFEALDLLYESLAQQLKIKAETFTKHSQMPVSWYGKRDFNPEKDDFKHIGFKINEQGKLEIEKKRYTYDIPLEVKIHQRGFPKARFVLLDTSGSMTQGFDRDNGSTKIIPWGDKSKYHGALVEWYGFLEYLKQNHLLNQTGISLANFGSRTDVGNGLIEAKKTALNPQFSGSTKINLNKVKSMFEGINNLIFTISDGEIENWSSIKDEFIKKAKDNIYFHLQLGEENEMTGDLEDEGFHVEYIRTADELRGRTVDLTDKLIRGNSK